MNNTNTEKLSLFPITSEINDRGNLQIGGCDVAKLAIDFGTPLYIFDEETIRIKCRTFQTEFRRYYQNTTVLYASKAFINKYIVSIVGEEGLGLDVVSGGELSIARASGFQPGKIYFHGNNKTRKEIEEAMDYRIGRIAVDNFFELNLVNEIANQKKTRQDILLRLSPGIDAHTHKFTTTGIVDSKFGFPIVTGQAEQAVAQSISSTNINLIGLHCHLGSPIFETEPYEMAIEVMMKFALEMSNKFKFTLKEFSPGGGFAVQYVMEKTAPGIEQYARALTNSYVNRIKENNLGSPELIVEPGRSIIAQAGVALYRVGSIKEIPGVRTYVCVDGGMGDNIRPALYGAQYEAIVANKAQEKETTKVTIAGKYCESGDILVKDITLAPVVSGDIIAIPVSGAYSIPMSSNYNMLTRPAITLLKNGKSRLIRKRETYKDFK